MLKSANMFGFFLMASLIMLSVSAALTGNMNLFSNTAIAQGYDDKYYGDDSYSKYPNDNKKYECRTGPFEGFFVSSVEFCKHAKFNDNDRKDNGYDDNDKNLQIFPANKVAELGDRWWQWIVSLNNITDVNPFTETGQAGCDVGLQDDGRLLFLVGSPSDPPLSGTFPVHDCKIKEGTSILFPIVNVFCAAFETNPPQNESQTRKCANEAQDTAFDLQLEIDGKEIQNLERQYRVDSPPGGFPFTSVPGNPATSLIGSSTGVSDGVWILLKHLTPGQHTITFSGKFDFTGIIPGEGQIIIDAGATYNLNIIPKYY
ncbi:MAG: hypothetical protein QOK90_10730 [Nitrososphaeraceae archaeon]|nr:hypothetical protein [Nitrososphaeraceae archaeon]